jgi:hypothetical protein
MMRATAAHTNVVETSRTMVTARPRRPKLAGPSLLARPETQVFSSISACQAAQGAVLAQAISNMKIAAVCMNLGQGQQ